jgi:hypothetical protein
LSELANQMNLYFQRNNFESLLVLQKKNKFSPFHIECNFSGGITRFPTKIYLPFMLDSEDWENLCITDQIVIFIPVKFYYYIYL